jgi:hypothetical protein
MIQYEKYSHSLLRKRFFTGLLMQGYYNFQFFKEIFYTLNHLFFR